MRVLIIDDDEDLRNLLAHYIRQEWPQAEVEEFDPLVREMPDDKFPFGDYDLIILDYMLGRGDGLEWLHAFKKRSDCPPVLFLTGAGNEIIAVRAMKAGASDYQRKQELTRERLITSIRDLTHDAAEKTLSPELAARMEGHMLGERVRITGFRILRLIGEGGMSRVYLASRDRDDEPLVVKILRSEATADKNALARFMEEYALVERIKSPHVARSTFALWTAVTLRRLCLTAYSNADSTMRRLAFGVTLRSENGQLMVNNATVTQPDIKCSNGVIHVIDQVLLPGS